MKRKFLGVFMIICVVLVVKSIAEFFKPSLPDKVNSANILKISPGMRVESVFNILGRPFSITALHGIHKIGCVSPNPSLDATMTKNTDIKKLVHEFMSSQKYCCDGNKRDLEEFDNITLVYTKRGILFSYPMLWIHFDTAFKVKNVYAKEYESGLLGDDPGIYGFGWAMDSTYLHLDYTKTEKWMNEEKFYRCFQASR